MKWLIHEHPVNFILYLYHNPPTKNYASKMSKESGSTFSYTVILIKKLEEIGLIEKNEQDYSKRTKFLKLTDKGKKIAEDLDKLKMVLMWE